MLNKVADTTEVHLGRTDRFFIGGHWVPPVLRSEHRCGYRQVQSRRPVRSDCSNGTNRDAASAGSHRRHYRTRQGVRCATLATGGGRPAHLDRGFFFEPTVFGHVDNHSLLAPEEIFGPVLSVIPADSEEQAIAIATDTAYGLNNSVFTNDAERAYRVAQRLRSGTVGHNVFRTDFSIAFGGYKQSGMGREGGIEGLDVVSRVQDGSSRRAACAFEVVSG
jgi:acyl-CoA reductase-like NAD-dependent aldehyde dehydrogenase